MKGQVVAEKYVIVCFVIICCLVFEGLELQSSPQAER